MPVHSKVPLRSIDGSDEATLKLLLRTILESVPDAMIVIDETGTMLAFSRAAQALFGHEAEDVIGKNVSMLMTDADRNHHDGYIDHYIETGEKQIIGIGRIVKARLADGKEIPVDLKIGETVIGDHRLFTGYIRDVSEIQANEHRTRQMQAELTNFSRLSAVGTMSSAMAHELNQPLTAVANYLEACRDLLDTPDEETLKLVQEAMDAATQQSVRAGQIVRRLRDFVSRGEIEKRPVELAPIISDAVSLAKIGMDGRLPRVIDKTPDGLPRVLIDRVQIRQVIVNLIKNAIEATRDLDRAEIRVTTQLEEDGSVRVEVSDNGPGLDSHDAEDVFQPFKSTKASGMGLGLSICQTIIDGHGGDIWAAPNKPNGVVFGFTLMSVQEG